jgi:hypothetical protein
VPDWQVKHFQGVTDEVQQEKDLDAPLFRPVKNNRTSTPTSISPLVPSTATL